MTNVHSGEDGGLHLRPAHEGPYIEQVDGLPGVNEAPDDKGVASWSDLKREKKNG